MNYGGRCTAFLSMRQLYLSFERLHLSMLDAEVGAVEGEEAPGVIHRLTDADADVGHDLVVGGGGLDEAAV